MNLNCIDAYHHIKGVCEPSNIVREGILAKNRVNLPDDERPDCWQCEEMAELFKQSCYKKFSSHQKKSLGITYGGKIGKRIGDSSMCIELSSGQIKPCFNFF